MSRHQLSYIVFGFFTLIYVYGYLTYGWSLSYVVLGFILWFLLVLYGSFFIQTNYHLKAISKVKTDKNLITL
jgi:hypothetical protein